MQGKVIVITGAFGALGKIVAAHARERGWTTAAIDYAAAPTGADPLTIGGADLTEADSASDAMRRIAEQAGRIDALLNIAGGFAWSQAADADVAMWDRMHALNLKTAVNASRAALPRLLESKGAIVNVGAAGALKAGAGFGPYAASKAGVHKLTESMAQELKGKVRVNAVLPSTLDTPQNRKDMPKTDPKIWVQPEELARVMLFLASDEASAVTGALIPVMGRV
ncbi:MAG TPA: SDR family NAD(P)-dependent oxidoreductase [Vitreimonas sp.]|uniref:SDR family NAD(P)-dependent oxidoreductase n=1 Tax=Vitreimonas sp. TaxID=3069702 RepID=UPI002D50CC26|nr:SDR family NAD(P)-dependent oxidoreductase [Vitreimonas sp.]HYD86070.1 SDR family NAD(P)-dependent oxidoreductase [Vitreimonas sp.]